MVAVNLSTKTGVGYTQATSTVEGVVKGGTVPSQTSGAAITAGYIGEVVEATITTGSVGTSEADITGASISLTAGVWQIYFAVAVGLVTGSSAGAESNIVILLTNSSNTRIGNTDAQFDLKNPASATYFGGTTLTNSTVVSISSTTTYKLRAARNDFIGTGSASVYNATDRRSKFYAVRIA